MSSHVSEEGGGGNHSSHGLLSTIITVEADSLAHGLLTFTGVNPNCEHYNKQAPALFQGGSNLVKYSKVSSMQLALFFGYFGVVETHNYQNSFIYSIFITQEDCGVLLYYWLYSCSEYSKMLRIFFLEL